MKLFPLIKKEHTMKEVKAAKNIFPTNSQFQSPYHCSIVVRATINNINNSTATEEEQQPRRR